MKRLLVAPVILSLGACGGSPSRPTSSSASTPATTSVTATATATAPSHRQESYAVGLRTVRIVDRRRRIQLPGGRTEPRTLLTYVRYPALGAPADRDRVDAPAARGGPYPLVIFGHGYNTTPEPYASLLRAWAQAGYVVAAPEFPLESSRAPGGANENDLINQPRDMTVLITRLLKHSSRFAPLIDASAIAVSGQSDGGETALTVTYGSRYRDNRVRAALILSGAKIPGVHGYRRPRGSPPLLATQGTSDTINLPSETAAFFDIASRPKFLLRLLGAPHLTPYTTQQPQLSIVERVTIAFMDRYLKGRGSAAGALKKAGNVAGVAELVAEP